jgi:hypothetical protein
MQRPLDNVVNAACGEYIPTNVLVHAVGANEFNVGILQMPLHHLSPQI